jgi:hypothetical protein
VTLPALSPTARSTPTSVRHDACAALYAKYQARIKTLPGLDRMLVSFQGNRRAAFYSWYTYREWFSEALVTSLLTALGHGLVWGQ